MTVLQHLSAIRRTLDHGERLRVWPTDPTYAVTDSGAVFSLYRAGRVRPVPFRLKATPDRHGYITYSVRSTAKHIRAHRMVLEAFDGPCPPGTESRHIDGDRLNNHIDNLQWGTHSENMRDVVRIGGDFGVGEGNGGSILTTKQALSIKRRTHHGEFCTTLAREYGVHPTTVGDIKLGKRWRHLHTVSSNRRSLIRRG